MLIVAVDGPGLQPDAMVDAFREHSVDVTVVGAGTDLSGIERGSATEVIAATPGAATIARTVAAKLGLAQPFGEFPLGREQLLAAGASRNVEVSDAFMLPSADVVDAPCFQEMRAPLRLRPRFADDTSAEWICAPGQDPGALLHRAARHAAELVVDTAPQGTRYEVQGVCDDDRILPWAVFELRVDIRNQQSVLRHVLTLPRGELRTRLIESAVEVLRAVGVPGGIACVEFELTPRDTVRLLDVRFAPLPGWSKTDAAYVATGTSLEHLLAERAHDKRLFERRLNAAAQGLPAPRLDMSISSIRSWGSPRIAGFSGVPLVRRSAAFREISLPMQGSPSGDGAICGWAVFIHQDEQTIRHSLSVLHELEDSNSLFARTQDFVALSR